VGGVNSCKSGVPFASPSLNDIISKSHRTPSLQQAMAEAGYEAAISLIDEAHAQDPNIAIVDGKEIPYELHYAQKSTHYLSLRCPDASVILKTAVRAQHFRR
jgi:hypothetical protein